MSAVAIRFWAPVGVLAALFLGIALATTFSEYSAGQLVALLAIYLALAAALHGGALLCARVAAPLGLVAASAVAAVLLWHVREQAGGNGMRPSVFLGLAFLLGCAYLPVLRSGARGASLGTLLRVALAAGAAFGALVAASWYGSNSMRWHLLHQNRLVGTPAYYAFAQPASRLRDALWETRTRTSAPAAAPVAAVSLADAPHLVFVTVDTLRADALAAYGGDPTWMPRLNAWAEGSLVFEDVLANATWTRPSIASFFTGMPQELHGAVDRADRLPESRETLAERLRARGYATAAFVSNFGAVGVDAGFGQGFEHFAELRAADAPYARALDVNRAVFDWLAARSASDARPVFLYVHYLDPHTPYLSGAAGGDLRAGYDAELRYVDVHLGELLARLQTLLEGPSVVFVTSDHGEEFGEHGDGGHGHSLYPEVAHLPALLRVPGVQPGRAATRLEARDFFDLLDRVVPAGGDVAAWAADRDRSRRYASIYTSTPFGLHRPYRATVGIRGLDEDGWLLLWSAYGATLELYDTEADPALRRNVAGQHPDRTRRLRAALHEQVPAWSVREPVEHTAETESLLKALGYIE